MMRVRTADEDLRHWLVSALTMARWRGYFEDRATGTAGNMPKINGAVVRGVPIAVPPLAEIRVLNSIIRRAFGVVESLVNELDQTAGRLAALERSVLAKAFRGELVEQDPADEPVSVLLDRIRTTRANEPERPRRGRGQRADDSGVAGTTPSNGHTTNGHHDESLDLVVGMFQVDRRLTATTIAEGTGLESSVVKKALKVLVDSGQVRIEGKARAATYSWIS